MLQIERISIRDANQNPFWQSAGYHMLYEDWSVDQTVYQTPSIGVFLNLPIRLTYALGSLIILTSLLGIFAAYRENSLLLKFVSVIPGPQHCPNLLSDQWSSDSDENFDR